MAKIDLDCLIIYNDNYSAVKNIKDCVQYDKNKNILEKKDILNILIYSSIRSKINYNEKNDNIIIRYIDDIDRNRGYLLLEESSKIKLNNNQLKLKLLINIHNDNIKKNIIFYKEKIKLKISELKELLDQNDLNNSFDDYPITDSFETPTPQNNPIDIIILSSNPLVELTSDRIIKKELYSIYDNVSELASISSVLEDTRINLSVEFNVLTKKNLISAIEIKQKFYI